MPQEYRLELKRARVAPVARAFEDGIRWKDGKTAPFIVERDWAGPAGHYYEQWSIRRDDEVIHSGPLRQMSVRGIQSISTYKDEVTAPIDIQPGTYKLVFIVEGRFMGEVDIEVSSEPAAVA